VDGRLARWTRRLAPWSQLVREVRIDWYLGVQVYAPE